MVAGVMLYTYGTWTLSVSISSLYILAALASAAISCLCEDTATSKHNIMSKHTRYIYIHRTMSNYSFTQVHTTIHWLLVQVVQYYNLLIACIL